MLPTPAQLRTLQPVERRSDRQPPPPGRWSATTRVGLGPVTDRAIAYVVIGVILVFVLFALVPDLRWW